MADAANGKDEKATSLSSIVDDGQQQVVVEGTDEKNRLTRHPRWTKLETLVLVEGKKVTENQGRRRPGLLIGTGGPESKWDCISSYCKKHGVNRGAVQCRKRWSNLICDFKKIKVWESRQKEEGESFWMMRSDVRRNRKLPGFFDREVYSVLDGKAARVILTSPMVVPIIVGDGKENGGTETSETENEDDGEAEEVHDDKEKHTPVYGSEGLEEPDELHRIPEVDNAKGTPEETISTAEPISASGMSSFHSLSFFNLFYIELVWLSKTDFTPRKNVQHFIGITKWNFIA